MKVLFVCRANIFRSRVAEYFFNKYSKKHTADSAGTEAERYSGFIIGEEVLRQFPGAKSMLEKFVFAEDIMKGRPKQLTPEMFEEHDKVVFLLEKEDEIPGFARGSKKTIFWEIEDGAKKDGKLNSYENIVSIVNEIETKVRELISEIE